MSNTALNPTNLEWFYRDGRPALLKKVIQDAADRGHVVLQDPCHRCGGRGGSNHWPGYTCFRCGGSGKEQPREAKVYTAEKLAKLEQAAEKRRAKKEEARRVAIVEQMAEVYAAVPDLKLALVKARMMGANLDKLRELAGRQLRLQNDIDTLFNQLLQSLECCGLTIPQARFVVQLVDRINERLASKREADADEAARREDRNCWLQEGRREVEGEILSVKERATDFGYVWKILVLQDDGNKVWGTLPRAIDGAADQLVGRRIHFTAKVSRSREDPLFGFYSRPTKASLIQDPEEEEIA